MVRRVKSQQAAAVLSGAHAAVGLGVSRLDMQPRPPYHLQMLGMEVEMETQMGAEVGV